MPDQQVMGKLILDAMKRKAERNNLKRYSLHNLADDAGTAQPYLTRVTHGQIPSRNMLIKICKALECSYQEAKEIMNAAGFSLSQSELEEERPAKKKVAA